MNANPHLTEEMETKLLIKKVKAIYEASPAHLVTPETQKYRLDYFKRLCDQLEAIQERANNFHYTIVALLSMDIEFEVKNGMIYI